MYEEINIIYWLMILNKLLQFTKLHMIYFFKIESLIFKIY